MQTGFFDLDTRYAGLDKLKSATGGEPLAKLNAVIDWELFRATLETVDAKQRKSTAGRKPTDRVVMFKMLILQNLYKMSDEMLEYQVTDRLSFMRFLGFDLNTGVPDARTVWAYREALKAHGLVDKLFAQFDAALIGMGVQLQSGQMIDASFVPAPVQRNSRQDNALIKEGSTPGDWSDKKKAHKDVDARWTKKGGQNWSWSWSSPHFTDTLSSQT
jgi:transposase, IS5 family